MTTTFFDSIIRLRFRKIIVARKEFYGTNKPLKIWDVNVNNIIISKLTETKSNSKCLIGYLNEVSFNITQSFDVTQNEWIC